MSDKKINVITEKDGVETVHKNVRRGKKTKIEDHYSRAEVRALMKGAITAEHKKEKARNDERRKGRGNT